MPKPATSTISKRPKKWTRAGFRTFCIERLTAKPKSAISVKATLAAMRTKFAEFKRSDKEFMHSLSLARCDLKRRGEKVSELIRDHLVNGRWA